MWTAPYKTYTKAILILLRIQIHLIIVEVDCVGVSRLRGQLIYPTPRRPGVRDGRIDHTIHAAHNNDHAGFLGHHWSLWHRGGRRKQFFLEFLFLIKVDEVTWCKNKR